LEGGSGETEFALGFEGKGCFCGVAGPIFDVVRFIEDDAEKVDGMEEGTFFVDSVYSFESRVLFSEDTLQDSVWQVRQSCLGGGYRW
jgi:hypothetical protein